MDVVEQSDEHAQPEASLDQQPPAQPTQTEETVPIAPGVYEAVTELPSAEQQDEKRMDIERDPDQDALPEAHLALDETPAQTEETVPVIPGVYEAKADPPTDAQREEKRRDVERNPDLHAGAEASLDIVPHVEPLHAEESVMLVPAECSSAGESSGSGDEGGRIDVDRVRAEESGNSMLVELSESAPSMSSVADDALAEPMELDADALGVVESAPTPEVEIPDAEPENEGGYESDNEDIGVGKESLGVPGEVESPPTPEVDIKDADEEDKEAISAYTRPPVHIHPQFSAVVEQPPTPTSPPAEHLEPEVAHIERRLTTEGEPSMPVAGLHNRPATPTLSPSRGDAESEEEGPGTPPMDPAPHILVTPAEEHQGARGELRLKEEESRPEIGQKVDAEAALELRMARERELF
ncbi:uncharacterized protein B0H18DRAFT_1022245 [Fomitopsis serialis]|uniref:uncharacterized protein n=1 Tax=Fomitopsis serialis TaxID=139415 RepID=UPI002007B971|nr:uncharacterized protein B0H18DRAFT_1022245 [Neoantrodia serialis]KAH9921160.1 hypothetical protein B0H18DRAFT_1022245 [Neoantrodia serialis]